MPDLGEPPTYAELIVILREVWASARRVQGQTLPNDPRTEYSIPKLVLDKVDAVVNRSFKVV